ncbi:MAG: urea transporter [Pseudolabrys sp.]
MIRLRFLALALGNPFMIKAPWIAALLWLALLLDIRYPIFAVIGLAVADGIAWLIGTGEKVKREGGLRANAIFASIAVAWLMTGSGASPEVQLAVELGAAIAASLIAAAIIRGLRDTILPPLGWGFCIVGGFLFTLFTVWTHTALAATLNWPRPHDALSWLESFFRSLGMLLFLPKVEAGILIALAILLWSRLMLITGIIGWIGGIAFGLLLERLGLTYLWLLAAHNYFLAGMLLASVLFLPGRGTALIALAAGMSASILSAYFQYLFPGSAYAFLPVPAILSVWLGVGALLLRDDSGYFKRNMASGVAPEMAWWNDAYWSQRFGRNEPLLGVPAAGLVQVTQGFDGPLSHVGRWRHAFDFQRPPPLAGMPADSIWEAPVYAPAGGIVEAVRGDVVDNPLGISNFAEMWGNYVIIRLDRGGWALLAHMRQGSLAVAPGIRVEAGTYLGLVGNSGRSPAPHLHLHAQGGREISASTVPFRLANFLSTNGAALPAHLHRWNAAAVPPVGAVVAAAQMNPRAHEAATSIAPGTTVWRVETEGVIPRAYRRYDTGAAVRVRIFIDEFGRHVFRSYGGGALVTSADPDAWRMVELRDVSCPLLKLIALGAPAVPYAAGMGLDWIEPAPICPDGPAGWFTLLALPYSSHPFSSLICACAAVPDDASPYLVVETRPVIPRAGVPAKARCHIERLRGPMKVEAEFDGGKLTFTMFSFEPGLPFERRDKRRS